MKTRKDKRVLDIKNTRMFLSVDHVDINSNGAAYLYYVVKQWKNGEQETVGHATVNLSKDFRMLGMKGDFTLNLFSDKMTRFEQDRP